VSSGRVPPALSLVIPACVVVGLLQLPRLSRDPGARQRRGAGRHLAPPHAELILNTALLVVGVTTVAVVSACRSPGW
jgi:hypothetical protein